MSKTSAILSWGLLWLLFGAGISSTIKWRPWEFEPYVDVQISESHLIGEKFFFTATFDKKGCQLLSFRPIGLFEGTPPLALLLKFIDREGRGDTEDRSLGLQTLYLVVDLSEGIPEAIEFRTQHDCDGEIVNRVFARVIPEHP